ncbi:MAG: hypothetical protein GC138_03615 [Gammaproteobacteria bacterium]|nr:hypothetical protein [Gammaproteobacteria bacterium]
MCFSSTASFTAAAVLLPAGTYCLKVSYSIERPYWALATVPFIFAIQQLLEGGVWLALEQGDALTARDLALGFLFFSHVFWLGWVGYSASLVETSPFRKRFFSYISFFGVVLGAIMYVPLLLDQARMTPEIIRHSIHYELTLLTDLYVSQELVTTCYAGIILLPLLLSSDRYHRVLGGLALVTGLVALALYDWAFISVWCYFAAVISLYIFVIMARRLRQRAEKMEPVRWDR